MAFLTVKILLSALLVTVIAEERQGRQLNWDNDLASPPAYHSADPYLASASSVLSAQQSKANYDAPDQDISRDSYSPSSSSSNYYAGSDYGYEAAPSDTASYTGNSASNYGYGNQYRPFTVPTTSRPFYSYYNHGNRDRLEDKVSSLSGLQSGKIAYLPLPNRLNYSQLAMSRGGVGAVDEVNRALYDDDSPLGGVGSRPSTSVSLLGSTNLRNVQSRQDDYGFGGGLYSLPPAGAYGGYGAGTYGAGGYGAGGYGAGGYGAGGYGAGGYGAGGYGAGGYGAGGYGTGGYGAGAYGASGYGYTWGSGYGSGLAPSSGGYGNYGLGGYGSYRSPLYSGYGGSFGDGYGYGMSGLGVWKPHHFLKKLKKAYKHLYKYGFPINGGFGGGYGYGSGYGNHYGAVAPYEPFYDVPTVWDLGKFVFKSVAKSIVKPIYSIISPFCGSFFYKRSDGLVDDKQNSFVSALTAFLPIGLFLAAIVPNIVSVSAGRRKRSDGEEVEMAKEEAAFPILDMISEYGARSLQEPKCQSKIVCEMGRMGGKPEANMLQRALWITANYVPESLAKMAGTDKLFRSIRSQQCSEFKCSTD